jgi:hypothetical protein
MTPLGPVFPSGIHPAHTTATRPSLPRRHFLPEIESIAILG